jgi:hypothetical protein
MRTRRHVRKIAAGFGTRGVNTAAIVLQEDAAALAAQKRPGARRLGVARGELPHHGLLVDAQAGGNARHFRGAHAHDGVAATVGALGAIDVRLHFGDDRLKRFDALVVLCQVAPESRFSALLASPSRWICTRSVTTPLA